MRTLSEVLAADGITLTCTSETRGPIERFRGTFHFQGRTMEHEWVQHVADSGVTPSVASVLGPVLCSAMSAEAADDFEAWTSTFDYNPGDWFTRDTYEEWLETARKLRAFLGDDRYESYGPDLVEHYE